MRGALIDFVIREDTPAEQIVAKAAFGDVDKVCKAMHCRRTAELVWIYAEVPVAMFAPLVEQYESDFENTWDRTAVEVIMKQLREGGPHQPVFFDVQGGDVAQGKHRLVAYWRCGFGLLPAFLVSRR